PLRNGPSLPADCPAQIASIRGKTHHASWRSVFHVDLFVVFHTLFPFPPYFHDRFSVSLFSARFSGAQKVGLHRYLGLESACRLDPLSGGLSRWFGRSLRGSNARSRSRHNLLPLRKPSLEQGFSAALAESLARREPAFAVRAAPRCRPRPGDVTGSMAWRGEA